MSPSETQALHDDGYAKGKAGNPKDFCSHDILYSPAKYSLWYRGWKKGRIDAGHERNPLYTWLTLAALIIGAITYYASNSPQSEPALAEATQPTESPEITDAPTPQETIESSISMDDEAPLQAYISEEMILETPSTTEATQTQLKPSSVEPAASVEFPETTVKASAKNELINRAYFTSGIENREPIDRLGEQTLYRKQLYFFSDFRGAQGQTLYHEWHYQRELMGKVEFKIKGPRWRVYSRKNIMPEWSGFWTVLIRDEQGNVLDQKRIEVQP